MYVKILTVVIIDSLLFTQLQWTNLAIKFPYEGVTELVCKQ